MSDQIIKKAFYDPEVGFIDYRKLYQKLKDEGHGVTLKQVKDVVQKQLATQLNIQRRRPKRFPSIWGIAPYVNMQMDIMVYNRYEWHQQKYILIIIDVYSRYAWARAL